VVKYVFIHKKRQRFRLTLFYLSHEVVNPSKLSISLRFDGYFIVSYTTELICQVWLGRLVEVSLNFKRSLKV